MLLGCASYSSSAWGGPSAIQQLARQQYDAALEGLLKLFIRNRSYSEGLPHKTLLQAVHITLGAVHTARFGAH